MERFLRRDRNVASKPYIPNHQTLYHICPILSNHYILVWALYPRYGGLSIGFVIFFCPKFWKKSNKFVICFKRFENVLKNQKTRKYGLLSTYRDLYDGVCILFDPRLKWAALDARQKAAG